MESFDTFLKLIKKKNCKIKDVKSFIRNNNINLNEYDKHGYTPLHYAIKTENPEIVKFLLFSDSDEDENTEEQIDIIKKADPNLNIKDLNKSINISPILFSLNYLNDETASFKIIKYLYKAGGNINYKDEEGETLFLQSCLKGRKDIINFLFNYNKNEEKIKSENKFDMNKDISKNGGGLHYAIMGDKEDIIEFLLENEIDVTIEDNQGNNCLQYALIEKNMNLFKLILDYIIKTDLLNDKQKKNLFNHQNKSGNTILHLLGVCKSQVVLNYVLKLNPEYSIDQSIKNNEGFTYIEVQDNIKNIEKNEKEIQIKLKEEKRKIKEEEKRMKELEDLKYAEELKKIKLQQEKQEEIGEFLLMHRGKIFLGIFVLVLILMFLVIKNAATKKPKII